MQKTSAYLRHVDHSPVSLDVRYFAYKIENALASKMNKEDLVTASLLKDARHHHRNVLMQLVQFWQILAAKRPDITRLNMVSERIHRQRTNALQKFTLLLSGGSVNPVVFRYWGLFVETVLEQPEAAERLYDEARLMADTDSRRRDTARQQVLRWGWGEWCG